MAGAGSTKNTFYQNRPSLVGNHFIDCFTNPLSCFEWNWYLVFCKESTRYSKKKSNDRPFHCQYCCSFSPKSDSHKENFISQSETKQTAASTGSTSSTTDTSSSIEEAKRIEEEKKAKEKAAEEEKIAKEKAAKELQEKGETLVKQLEESQDTSQVKSAKETVNQIENNDKKTELLGRIAAVESFISQKEEEKRAAREAETKAQQQDRIVYVANHGNAKVYWYSKDRMPPKTNKANVVEMTEADAIAAGKRPSKTE